MAVLWGVAAAFGCPVCDTDNGAAVRAGIFNANFLRNLALMLAPLGVVGIIVGVIYFGLPRRLKFEKSFRRAL